MAASLRDLRRKIKSISGTKKLTQAMQMVSASKMQKATKLAQASVSYTKLAWEIIKNIRTKTDVSNHPLLSNRPVKKIALILFTTNKGLCGGLNTQIFKKLTHFINERKINNSDIKLITVGNKGKNFAARFFKEMYFADFSYSDSTVNFNDITAISKLVIDGYRNKDYDAVYIIYNQFISTINQKAVIRQILPVPSLLEAEEWQKNEKIIEQTETRQTDKISIKKEYVFEPNINFILNNIIPAIINTQIYQILLDANASEHSARMIAMKNATDNASNLIDDLSLTYNSMRQAAITNEINEIATGAEALRS